MFLSLCGRVVLRFSVPSVNPIIETSFGPADDVSSVLSAPPSCPGFPL